MRISSAAFEQAYTVQVEKLAQNVMKAEGEGAVQLIQQSAPKLLPPVGVNGEGSHVNTYA